MLPTSSSELRLTPKMSFFANTHAQAAIAAAHSADSHSAHIADTTMWTGSGEWKPSLQYRGRRRLLPSRRDGPGQQQHFGCQPDDEDVVVEGASLESLILRGALE